MIRVILTCSSLEEDGGSIISNFWFIEDWLDRRGFDYFTQSGEAKRLVFFADYNHTFPHEEFAEYVMSWQHSGSVVLIILLEHERPQVRSPQDRERT